MFVNTLSNPKYQELINSNPAVKELVDYISDTNTMTMRNMTHEINNILTLINSSLQIIESSHPEVMDFKYWDCTMSDLKYLINLVSDISIFNNSNNLSLTETNVCDMLNSIVTSFTAISKDINVSIDLADNIPIIQADKTKLYQVFINIIKNAFEALKNVSKPYINISVNSDRDYIYIVVSDNGCGMTAEQLENIFTPMISYKSTGTGLGLSISKKIIDAHLGSISVQSTPDNGTSFMVTIPVQCNLH